MRCIDAYIPTENGWEALRGVINEGSTIGTWLERPDENTLHVRMLVRKEDTGALLDRFEHRFGEREGFRMIVLPVEATVPRPEVKIEEDKMVEESAEKKKTRRHVAREEIYADIAGVASPSRGYAAMVALSAIVAGIGILRDNDAVVIGAMVIAPLLGPNVGLSLAATLADAQLAKRALGALITGIIITLGLSVAWGMLARVEPEMPGIASRAQAGLSDVVLALASGCAGVLAFTSGASATLVGVMVAVALLPPLVVTGMLLGAGHYDSAGSAALVFSANTICINLAGVVTFLVQGIRPLSWWEKRKARHATVFAIVLWLVLLGLLILTLTQAQLSERFAEYFSGL